MSEPNLVPYLNRLSPKEKAVLLRLLNELPEHEHHHPGTLPFVSMKTAIGALKFVSNNTYTMDKWKAQQRIAKQILGKLGGNIAPGAARFVMYLDGAKVYRHFGRHPQRGKVLPHIPKVKVTVGVKYSLPYKDYVPDKDVLVTPTVALRRIGSGTWEVTVAERCRAAAEAWLQQTCA